MRADSADRDVATSDAADQSEDSASAGTCSVGYVRIIPSIALVQHVIVFSTVPQYTALPGPFYCKLWT